MAGVGGVDGHQSQQKPESQSSHNSDLNFEDVLKDAAELFSEEISEESQIKKDKKKDDYKLGASLNSLGISGVNAVQQSVAAKPLLELISDEDIIKLGKTADKYIRQELPFHTF